MTDMEDSMAVVLARLHAERVGVPGVKLFVQDYYQSFRPDARAAIAAMREPTDAMVSNAISQQESAFCNTPGCCHEKIIYQAMIDEALK